MVDSVSLAKLLRIFVATVESLDRKQIDQLLSGNAKLGLVAGKKKDNARSKISDQTGILERLNNAKDRNDARRVLEEVTNKDALSALARTLKVHVIKTDRKEVIESKIVEFIIGGKLRTEAIRSLNLKGGSGRLPDRK